MNHNDIMSAEDAKILEAAKNICAKYADIFNDVSADSTRMPEIRAYLTTSIRFDDARDALSSALIAAEIRADQTVLQRD